MKESIESLNVAPPENGGTDPTVTVLKNMISPKSPRKAWEDNPLLDPVNVEILEAINISGVESAKAFENERRDFIEEGDSSLKRLVRKLFFDIHHDPPNGYVNIGEISEKLGIARSKLNTRIEVMLRVGLFEMLIHRGFNSGATWDLSSTVPDPDKYRITKIGIELLGLGKQPDMLPVL